MPPPSTSSTSSSSEESSGNGASEPSAVTCPLLKMETSPLVPPGGVDDDPNDGLLAGIVSFFFLSFLSFFFCFYETNVKQLQILKNRNTQNKKYQEQQRWRLHVVLYRKGKMMMLCYCTNQTIETK